MKFYKLNLVILLCVVFFSACSTTKDVQRNKKSIIENIKIKNKLINFQSKIYINAKLNDQINRATGKIKIAKTDSIQLSLYGPFGISVGKLYSDPNNLVFINPITNQVLLGTPTNSNMKATIKVDLSYNDFIRLIRNEPPEDISLYNYYKDLSEIEKVYIFAKGNDFIDYIVLKDNHLNQFQRKTKQGDIILHVFYKHFQYVDKIFFPTRQVYKFPDINAVVDIEFKEFNTIEKFEKPFSFEIPKNMELINLDWR